jgi:hypothetical protein
LAPPHKGQVEFGKAFMSPGKMGKMGTDHDFLEWEKIVCSVWPLRILRFGFWRRLLACRLMSGEPEILHRTRT